MSKKFLALFTSAIIAFVLFACGDGATSGEHKHTVIEVEASQSTCDTHGYEKHYKCKGCNKLFDSEDAVNEITLEQIELPFEHDYSTQFTGDETGHWHACTRCGAKDTLRSHNKNIVQAVSATSFTDGKTAGYVCRDCRFEKEGDVIPKTTAFVQRRYEDLDYCLHEPENVGETSTKVPLVLFLHGAGERGNDNEAQLKNCIQQVVYNGSNSPFMQSVVIAPQCPNGMQWTDTPWANGNYRLSSVAESVTMGKVVKLINYYKSLEYIDSDRIYVIGISMGGFGTWDLLARHSDIFAAGVPICGGGATDAIDILKDIPIYTFHDTTDPIVPYSGTQEMVNGIKAAGGEKINFCTFSNSGGHIIWDKAITYRGDSKNPDLTEWLFSKTKSH